MKGLLFTVQKALPLLVDGGSIILNASAAASTGSPTFSVYSATKAAVRSFARSWTPDLKHRHMRVNAFSPGATETAGWHGLARTEAHAQELNALVSTIPLGRMAAADEMAQVAVFLASDYSSDVTGVERFVDGGMAQIEPLCPERVWPGLGLTASSLC